ncbi:MAG: thioredoxin family protein [Verrucomicrobiota bacterium]
MKKLVFGAFIALALIGATAGESSAWLTDLTKAQALAKAEKKLVLLDFTGSDWCPPCKALHKNVLSKPEFEAYAKTNLVLVEVDFPNEKPQSAELKKSNEQLQEKFKIDSYPTIIVLDAEGKVISRKSGYGGTSAKEFIAGLEKLKK